ncbi:hypothetical protein [Kitasatospora sp. NPDC093679]|uniref:hypothetical protein n=1 Tax=Kitasatospora sp. NPDC093679 TaxID=3154983 RepID=UPI00343610A0
MSSTASRHRRPPAPRLPDDADARLRAIAGGQPVEEEGVALFPGSTVPYVYRTVHRPVTPAAGGEQSAAARDRRKELIGYDELNGDQECPCQ